MTFPWTVMLLLQKGTTTWGKVANLSYSATWPGTSHSPLSGLGAVLCNGSFWSIHRLCNDKGEVKLNGQGWGWQHREDHREKAQLTRAWGAATTQRGQKASTICFASQMSLRNTRPIMRPLLPNLNCFMTSNAQGVCQAWGRQGQPGLVSPISVSKISVRSPVWRMGTSPGREGGLYPGYGDSAPAVPTTLRQGACLSPQMQSQPEESETPPRKRSRIYT